MSKVAVNSRIYSAIDALSPYFDSPDAGTDLPFFVNNYSIK